MENEKQHLIVVQPDQMEHEVVMSYLERARQIWLPSHQKSVRAAGMNAEFASEAKRHMERIDRLHRQHPIESGSEVGFEFPG
jgi:hypothetical protein